MPVETPEKVTARPKAELEIKRLVGQWNRENLSKNQVTGLAHPEKKLSLEKIMPFIVDAELRQSGMAENDPYAWEADTFLEWVKAQGLTLPGSEPQPLKQKQAAA